MFIHFHHVHNVHRIEYHIHLLESSLFISGIIIYNHGEIEKVLQSCLFPFLQMQTIQRVSAKCFFTESDTLQLFSLALF